MSQNYRRRQGLSERRKSTTGPIYIIEQEQDEEEPEDEQINQIDNRRLSTCLNQQRRLSTVSQLFLPHGNEYHPQDHVPATGPEAPQTFLVQTLENDASNLQRRFSIVRPTYEKLSEGSVEEVKKDIKIRILFFLEPILSGFILFPILVLFWECGWNSILILLNVLNHFPANLHLDEITQEDFESYSWESLVIPYLITQFLLLQLYLFQNQIYLFLRRQNLVIRTILLKLHIFLLSTIYIFQWEMLWTIWDQFTPHEWYFELTLSIGSLFGLIVFIGHLSDLVCSPFVLSYDSIDCCIHFGCPLLTREMKQWKINLINFILYEIVISNISVMVWRGIYHYLDDYLYPNHLVLSAGICLIIGYTIYFPLMYFQTYLEELNLKYNFWTFISINFPQFYRNIRHLLAFLSSLFAWRGFWLLFDEYIYIYEDYYKTYLMFYLISFLFLCLIESASSINGPLSTLEDEFKFFPIYPHCYFSIIYTKISKLKVFRGKTEEENTKL